MIGFLQRGVLFDDGVGGLVGEDGEHMDVALLASLLRGLAEVLRWQIPTLGANASLGRRTARDA